MAQAIEPLVEEFEPIPEPRLQLPDGVGELMAQQPRVLDLSQPPREPTLEEEIARGPRFLDEECPKPSELKRINEITTNISPEAGDFPQECSLGDEIFQPRNWAMTTYTWKASGLCHKPLYFEQVGLERYGHTAGPVLEPFIAGAHFFGTFPILPYKMGMDPPWECVYDLGYYRPGSCAPRLIYMPGLSLRGALVEAGVWTGMVFLIP